MPKSMSPKRHNRSRIKNKQKSSSSLVLSGEDNSENESNDKEGKEDADGKDEANPFKPPTRLKKPNRKNNAVK